MKEFLMSPQIAAKVQGNNGHLYLRALKEEIAVELEIGAKTEEKDLLFHKLFHRDSSLKVEAEARYNLGDVNNAEAVGFDNLQERVQDPERNRDLAHESVFDKLLAEYFLTKRASIHNVNQLVDSISAQFDDRRFKEGHEFRTEDKLAKNPHSYPFEV